MRTGVEAFTKAETVRPGVEAFTKAETVRPGVEAFTKPETVRLGVEAFTKAETVRPSNSSGPGGGRCLNTVPARDQNLHQRRRPRGGQYR